MTLLKSRLRSSQNRQRRTALAHVSLMFEAEIWMNYLWTAVNHGVAIVVLILPLLA